MEGSILRIFLIGKSFGNTMSNGEMALKKHVCKAVIIKNELLKKVNTSRIRSR